MMGSILGGGFRVLTTGLALGLEEMVGHDWPCFLKDNWELSVPLKHREGSVTCALAPSESALLGAMCN